MKVEIEHKPGELADKLADVIRVVLDLSVQDLAHHSCGDDCACRGGLSKSRALDEAERDFQFGRTRAMFAEATARIRARGEQARKGVEKMLAEPELLRAKKGWMGALTTTALHAIARFIRSVHSALAVDLFGPESIAPETLAELVDS